MNLNLDFSTLRRPKTWAATAGVGGVLLLLTGFAHAHASQDPALSALLTHLERSTNSLTTQQHQIEELQLVQRQQAAQLSTVTEQAQHLMELVQQFTQESQGGTARAEGRLSRIDNSLARVESYLHTPQILQQTLERQQRLAR